MQRYLTTSLLVLALSLTMAFAQDTSPFTDVKRNETSAVKNQQRTGTCWSYATISFLESELLRMGKGEYDLSEMYVVRNTYLTKAKDYIYNHGKANFSEGGQAHDVLNTIKEAGLVPESAYRGNRYDEKTHNHSEMSKVLKGMLDALVGQRRNLSSVWFEGFESLLNVYMGENPEHFQYNNTEYTPQGFITNELELDLDAYVELTSYTHHPFYKPFDLEVPDNWSHDPYFNLPIDALIETLDHAIMEGYTFVWDGDVSELGFNHNKGEAVLKEGEKADQESRQHNFLNWQSTDDHLMHMVGIAKDVNGKKFYITKNSWGADSNEFGGFLYISEDYVRLHTVAIMVHKAAIPRKVAVKIFDK